MKWEADQRDGTIGWNPPKRQGEEPQSRMRATVDIDEALTDAKTLAVLDVWWDVRAHEAPAFSGGVRDAWPALMVEGLAVCKAESMAIGDFTRWEAARG